MPKKTTKKSAPKKKDAEQPLDSETPDPIAPAAEGGTFEDTDTVVDPIADAEPELTEAVQGDFPERTVADGVQRVEAVDGTLPKLGPNQQYFETPDGRIYIGPGDQHSVPDPENPRREINPMRKGGISR